MRKLYQEFFYVPKCGKVRDKVMVVRMFTMVAVIVLCLASMAVTAYAYFSYNITSGVNVIRAAHFETKVTVQIKDSSGAEVKVNTSNHISHWAQLDADTKYLITLEHTKRSTAKTGFVIITAENCDVKYHTQQLGKDGNGITEQVSFWLQPTAETKVTFLSHWGTSSHYGYEIENDPLYITQGETVSLVINGAVNNTKPQQNPTPPPAQATNPPEKTEPPATEETVTIETQAPVIEETQNTEQPTTEVSQNEPQSIEQTSEPENETAGDNP